MSRRHEEQQETQLSVAVLSFSLEHVTTRDETEQSCCDQSFQGFTNPDRSGKHGFTCSSTSFSSSFFFCYMVDVNKLWARVSLGGREAGQKKQLPLSGQTIIPLCFLVVVGSSLARDENHLKDVSGFLGKCQSLFRFSWMLLQFHIWLVRKNGKREKTENNTFLSFLSVSSGNWK